MDIRVLFPQTYDHMNYLKHIADHCSGHKAMFKLLLKHEQAHEWVHNALNLKPQYLRS